MNWKVGDRAVTKGDEVITELVVSSFEYCRRCNICIDCGQLVGAIWKPGFTEDIQDVYCLDCLQPADREKKLRELIKTSKALHDRMKYYCDDLWHEEFDAFETALIDLGKEV